MTQVSSSFSLAGGMDLVTPELQQRPGSVIASLNYEPVAAGYRRLAGYERYDGEIAPSSISSYYVLHFTALNVVVATGTPLKANVFGTGSVITAASPVITSGTIGGGDAAGYVPVFVIAQPSVGAFLRVNGTGPTAAIADGPAVLNESVPEAANHAWLIAVREMMRARIDAVPGSGPVRGVHFISGDVVAVRDDGLGNGVMYRAVVGGGWQAVTVGGTYSFDSGGTYEPVVGDRASDAALTISGYITSITLTSGTWAGGDAAGTVTLSYPSYPNGENITIGFGAGLHTDVFTLTSVGTSYTLPAGGNYEFINHNFYGASNRIAIYGVNGVGPAFVYDPVAETLAPISTGMVVDTPNHIAEHRGSLFLSFPGGSVQFSTVGEPLSFNPIVGAGEIAVGSEVTALISANTTTLGILAERGVFALYGNDASDYVLQELTNEAGALAGTAQKLGDVLYMDNGGIRSIAATASFGDFTFGTISRAIAPLLERYRRDGINPTTSLVSRVADQYWVFFDDGTAVIVYMGFGPKKPVLLPIDLGIVVKCCCSVEVDGVERIFFGSGTDGFVYELNKGTSFDGNNIEHYIRFPFNTFGRPTLNKRLVKATIGLFGSSPTIYGTFDFDFGATAGSPSQAAFITEGSAQLTSLGTHEASELTYLSNVAEIYEDGIFASVSLKLSGLTSVEDPYTLTSVTYHLSPRGERR
jgi:hypothetical protein